MLPTVRLFLKGDFYGAKVKKSNIIIYKKARLFLVYLIKELTWDKYVTFIDIFCNKIIDWEKLNSENSTDVIISTCLEFERTATMCYVIIIIILVNWLRSNLESCNYFSVSQAFWVDTFLQITLGENYDHPQTPISIMRK